MPSTDKVLNFPLVAISDGIISYLQYVFGNPEISPSDYRWNVDDRQTQIFIGAPYTVTRDKVGDYPTITVARGNFNYENSFIDNLEGADANTHENKKYRDLMRGPISIICESGAAPEATGLAQFVAIHLQSNRHAIAGALGFVHRIVWNGISGEQPVKEEAEITRWQSILSLSVHLYQPWFKIETEPQPWKRLNIYHGKLPAERESVYGQITAGSQYLTDNGANFGFFNDDDPQILATEFNKGWYYVTFADSSPKKYTVVEVESKRLKLTYVDEDGNDVPFNPTTTGQVSYKLLWNSIHVNIELPRKS